METDGLFTLFLLLAIAFTLTFIQQLQKIERNIREIPNNLLHFFINPTFVFIAFSVIFISLFFLIIFRHRSHIKFKNLLEKQNEEEIDESNFEDKWNSEDTPKVENLFELQPPEKPRRNVNIKVDSNKRYFHKKNISKDEVEYLLKKGYHIKKYKNILNGKMENFLLQPRHNESFTHLFLTHNISEFLEKKKIETVLFVTKKPDIVFEINGKMFAIEIETGSIFSKISRMKEKLKVLENYDKWFFVVTDRNKVKKYKKYGDAVDKRYVKSKLDKLVKLAKNT